jgi:hypothetical protein
MAFDIKRPVIDRESGEYDEQAALAYQDAILELFANSPERIAYSEQGSEIGWTSMFLEYAMSYLGLTPPEMGEGDFNEVLFEIIPRKVAVGPEEAPDIVAELRAFWSFLGRAYELPNAPKLLALLDDQAVRRLEHELANPANFGMAKSLVMQGKARGFDTTTQAGLEAWMHTYNAELGAPPPMFTGPSDVLPLPRSPSSSGAKARKEKSRRKMAKASRKQNRRK